MSLDDMDKEPILLANVFQRALEYYKREFKFFISVSLLYAILSEGGGFFISKFSIPMEEQVFLRAFVNIILACWASIVIIYTASCLASRKRFSPEQSMKLARRRYGRYLAVYLAMLSVIVCGFLLFIIPGLYFMTIFLFVDILVVVENVTFRQAFRRSAEMVRPYFWKVFVYLFVIVGVSLFPEVLYQTGLKLAPDSAMALQKLAAVLIMPFIMIAQVELFYNIKVRSSHEPFSYEDQFDSVTNDE